jgi:neutral ceramidase
MLSVGRSCIDITPPVGTPLGGWPVERVSERIHRPLNCRVLVIRHADVEVLLITLDLLGTSSEYADRVRAAVAAATGISPTAILLTSSHTHSGPVMPPCLMQGVSPPDETYLANLEGLIIEAVAAARQERIVVRVGAAAGNCDLAVSRRRLDEHGRAYWPPRADPDLPVDRTVNVVRFETPDGRTPAVVFSYGCHPTVAGPSHDIGPDFPGRAREVVEQAFPGATAYFLLGNAADVRPNYTHPDGTFRWDVPRELIESAGERLGRAAVVLARDLKAACDGPVRIGEAACELVTRSGTQVRACGFHAIRVGPVDLVTNPAETFSEIGLELRERWPRPLMFASLTNGFVGYVPTKAAHAAGGYEVERAFEHFGLDSPLSEESGELLLSGMHCALSSMDGREP